MGMGEIMGKYEILMILVMSLFLIPIGDIVYVIISIIRSPKIIIPPIENPLLPPRGVLSNLITMFYIYK